MVSGVARMVRTFAASWWLSVWQLAETSFCFTFFFSSRRRHTRFKCDWSSDVCSSDLVPERRLSGVRHLVPLLIGRCVCDVAVVPVPPLVWRGLRIARGRVLPDLLPAQRRDVEVVPRAPHLLLAAGVDGGGSQPPGPLPGRPLRTLPPLPPQPAPQPSPYVHPPPPPP